MYIKTPLWPVFAALTVGFSPTVFAETVNAPAPNAFLATLADSAEKQMNLRKWTVQSSGMYTIRVPANSGIQIRINGNLVIDATGTRGDDIGELITAFVSLDAGDQAVDISGVTAENANISLITVNAVGQTPLPLLEVTAKIDQNEANAILASRAGLDVPGPLDNPSTASASSSAPFTPFSIGGGSSGAAREVTAGATSKVEGLQMASSATVVEDEMAPMQRTAVGSSTSAASANGSTTTRSSSIFSGLNLPPNAVAGGVGRVVAPVPGIPNVGSPSPSPTPTAPPVVPPVLPPANNIVEVSPLSPPANVQLNEMIQLTSAGNEEGFVPNTGATLFGAVQAGAIYDTIEVTFEPNTRSEPTMVSVSPEKGQFAVRMFAEDFAGSPEVTVTLVGKLSSNADVTSQPVSYTVTGVAPSNGVTQALSRLTFGPTPDLYARIRAIGFEAFVREQLNPASINDSAFTQSRPQDLLDMATNNTRDMFRSLTAYDTAHAAFSERQLQEVMGRFWANHFHAITKGTEIKQQNITDRQFFRDNAFGNFEDMLLYSARSPLMSQYLDNDNNRVDGNRGLNQNYAREILELSTVGVEASYNAETDSGYTVDDINAIAAIFTGWAYRQSNTTSDNSQPRQYEFAFFPERHAPGPKTVPFLDVTIPEGGVSEGEQLISILAQHPSTQNRVCGKIVQLLVADQPPANLVSACAAAWDASGGEVVPMLEAILLDPSYITTVEFQRNKVKNPFEYAISMIRAFGAEPVADREADFYRRFREVFEHAGYVPLEFGAPTGLPEVSSAWTSSAKLVGAYDGINHIAENRENYGIDLLEDVTDMGLESAEEVAAYLLTVATADRFTKQEFDRVVDVLKGNDGFDPLSDGSDERRALERAMGLIVITPSFLLQ